MKVKKNSVSLFFLIMMSSAFVVSIRNLPTIAETQMQMIFFGIVAVIIFFIPGALSSAELASGWPQLGGITVWVREAFGKRWGLAAGWFQWTYMIISVLAMLYFISASLSYVFDPSLAQNKLYLIITELFLIWFFTFLNLKGLKISKVISTIGFLSGVIFPVLFLILLTIIYLMQGNPIKMDLSLNVNNLFPNFKQLSTLVLLVGFMRAFGGIEASAAHANSVENPQKNYPIAIMIVVVIGLLVNIIGSMSVGIVIPRSEISLIAGVMDTFSYFFNTFKITFLIPIMGLLVAIGQIGGFSTWITGPAKGLLEMGNEGMLPPFFIKVNKNQVPVNMMLIQAIVISILGSFVLIYADSINIAFWITVAFSMMIYVSMYFLMFLSVLYLRYKKPNVKRNYKIPGKKIGVWISSIVGMIGMVFSFLIALIPPSQLPETHHTLYVTLLVVGIIIVFLVPFIITHFEKPSWKKNK
ncbi:MAG: amino acid permease [Parachlamydiales bacterium]|nr:amino acid permease [Parachlamydiales bacterium]